MKNVTMFVWNQFTNDARVMRECTALSESKYNVNLIALKLKSDHLKKHESINEYFHVFRVTKKSYIFELLFKNKTLTIVSGLLLNLILLYLLTINLKVLVIVLPIFLAEILFVASKKIRTILINLSTIVRMTIAGYKQNADIYHANDLNTLPQAIFCSKFRLKPKRLVYDSHEVQSDRTGYNKVFIKFVEGILIKFIDTMIVENETRANHNVELYGFKPNVLHNYSMLLNIEEYQSANLHTKLNINQNEKILLYQGGIQIGRGLNNLIQAMNYIVEGHLVFIGDGRIKEDLKQQAQNSVHADRIHFIDKVKLEELPSYTKDAYLGFQVLQNICFNHYSASSNKLFEYLMAEVPVIACNFPEISKVVKENEVGLVVDSHDPVKIAGGVNRLLSDRVLYEKFKENTKQAKTKYNWKNEKKYLLAVYEKL